MHAQTSGRNTHLLVEDGHEVKVVALWVDAGLAVYGRQDQHLRRLVLEYCVTYHPELPRCAHT